MSEHPGPRDDEKEKNKGEIKQEQDRKPARKQWVNKDHKEKKRKKLNEDERESKEQKKERQNKEMKNQTTR